jgi:hypothetical protein
MDRKLKAALIAGLVLAAVESAFYIVPALARVNGTTDFIRGEDRQRNRNCGHTCLQNQARDCSCHLECCENQTCLCAGNQYQHQHRCAYQNMLSP